MTIPPKAIDNTICACFYGEISNGPPESDPRTAYRRWLSLVAKPATFVHEEPLCEKLRADLDRVGEAAFVEGWAHLLAVHAEVPDELLELLRRIYEPGVSEHLARRGKVGRA